MCECQFSVSPNFNNVFGGFEITEPINPIDIALPLLELVIVHMYIVMNTQSMIKFYVVTNIEAGHKSCDTYIRQFLDVKLTTYLIKYPNYGNSLLIVTAVFKINEYSGFFKVY